MSKDIFRTALIVFAALSGLSTPSRAEGVGRLLFINPDTGQNAIGGIDQSGKYHDFSGGVVTSMIGQNTLVPTASGVFAYAMSGSASVVDLDGRGLPRFSSTNVGSSWNQVHWPRQLSVLSEYRQERALRRQVQTAN